MSLEEFFTSGRAVELILLFVLLEAIVLVAWLARSGRRRLVVPVLANLASGAALMLAVRSALIDDPWPLVAAFLLGSFFAHVTELALRFRNDS